MLFTRQWPPIPNTTLIILSTSSILSTRYPITKLLMQSTPASIIPPTRLLLTGLLVHPPVQPTLTYLRLTDLRPLRARSTPTRPQLSGLLHLPVQSIRGIPLLGARRFHPLLLQHTLATIIQTLHCARRSLLSRRSAAGPMRIS